jgi:hypothetical protein
MKRTIFSLVVVALLSIGGAGDALATCPDISGPTCSPSCFYNYAIAQSCYSTDHASPTTSSCGNEAWSFGDAGSAYFQFTVGSTYYNADHWKATSRIYFNDPNNSNTNWVWFAVRVYHNGNPTTYQIVSWSGTDGDITGCALSSSDFHAVTGDSVEIWVVTAAASGTPTITVETPNLVNYN